ncbi:MAG: glutamate racemase [Oscillospiraceae bacterium]|nr:glutamate racemase [Oscillospiraceae bacterium]
MDNRPIGIFDSGVGGLSAVRTLLETAANERFVYFGDTARVPYGDRTAEDIKALSRQDARFLRTKDVKALLIACNTITANALPEIQADSGAIPVIGVVEPAARAAAAATKTGRIGLIATNATVRSGVYERAIAQHLPSAHVTAQGCPKLVPLIESGHTRAGDPALMEAAAEYLRPLQEAAVDTVILGCTHYPLIAGAVSQIMGPDVRLIDSGGASIGALLSVLEERDALADTSAPGGQVYYCSARQEDFVSVAAAFLGRDIGALTETIEIESY